MTARHQTPARPILVSDTSAAPIHPADVFGQYERLRRFEMAEWHRRQFYIVPVASLNLADDLDWLETED